MNRQLAAGRKFSSKLERNGAAPDFSFGSDKFVQSHANWSRDRELQCVVGKPSEYDIEAVEDLKLMSVSEMNMHTPVAYGVKDLVHGSVFHGSSQTGSIA